MWKHGVHRAIAQDINNLLIISLWLLCIFFQDTWKMLQFLRNKSQGYVCLKSIKKQLSRGSLCWNSTSHYGNNERKLATVQLTFWISDLSFLNGKTVSFKTIYGIKFEHRVTFLYICSVSYKMFVCLKNWISIQGNVFILPWLISLKSSQPFVQYNKITCLILWVTDI